MVRPTDVSHWIAVLLALGVGVLGGDRPLPAQDRLAVGAERDPGGPTVADPVDRFSFPGADSILEEVHCGIVNGRLTAGVLYKDLAAIDGLWAPPYVSSGFRLSVRLMDRQVATQQYVWWPFKVRRSGIIEGIRVETSTVLVPGKRAGLLVLQLDNPGDQAREVPLRFDVAGTLDRTLTWEFAAPVSHTRTSPAVEHETFLLKQGALAIALEAGPGKVRWDTAGSAGTAALSVPPRGAAAFYLAFAIGARSDAMAECRAVAADPEAAIREADDAHRRAVRDLFDRLPTLTSSHAGLVRFYDRCLVHLLMNRWDVPEFVLHPYFGTGSVRGGCVCSYLWNFGELWEVLPLYDPRATREHIRQYLKTDLTRHFAFNPMTGLAFGPWYMVNQEKIIGLVYYYVKNTGDVRFLSEIIDGKTVLEHVIANATYGDDPARPVALIDYGHSNSHLELRRGYPYNHKMPDLNGRRYANYLMAAQLAEAAGRPAEFLKSRAAALKPLLKREMWNPANRWFDFEDAAGKKSCRYTVQIFKLFGSGVLDAEQEAGLLGHLNQREFLSEFGLHSLSKTDVAYDPADIDNGGPGCCTSFPPQIAERLYKSGHPRVAEDVLRRILWWGQRMPYWGDSLVAERIDYRKDTPLQCAVDGAAAAQCIVFGMFGVERRFDGSIFVRPRPPAFAPHIALRGLKLAGAVLEISVEGDRFQVVCGQRAIRAKVGQTVCVKDGKVTILHLNREDLP